MSEGRSLAERSSVIAAALDGRWLAPVVKTQTRSTNQDAAALARCETLPTGAWALITADYQTAGRGRYGRRWEAAPGEAILLTVATRVQLPIDRWPSASIVVGHAVIETLRDELNLNEERDFLGIRWPNDLLMGADQRKLAGVLCERITDPKQPALWVAGVGINLTRPSSPPGIAPYCAGLDERASHIDIDRLVGRLAMAIAHHVDAWQLRGGRLLPELHGKNLRFTGVEVGLDLGDGQRTAAWLSGLDATGGLIVREMDGSEPTGPQRVVVPHRLLDARTDPPWHHPPAPGQAKAH
ncbi:MAG: biotin--[acetyl-CoA-carboxylase] ligase [Myxococcales bacterium]|nr:biotin--[acetyl-CoA-carboxylase] ligase [Myxococcales bacterium]